MKEKYLLDFKKFYIIHIMLTDFCNCRCTYCQQFSEYGGNDVPLHKLENLVDFFSILPKEKRTFFLEGGEPSFFKNLNPFLNFLFLKKESVVFLTNGRVPKKHYSVLSDYLQNGTIRHIGLHTPIGKEPFSEIWVKEITSFLEYLSNRGLEQKVIYLGLLYDTSLTLKEVFEIFRFHLSFPKLTLSMSYCFPHPSKLGRCHIDFYGRTELMKYVGKAYKFMIQNRIMPIIDGTLPCIVPDLLELSFFKDFLCSKKMNMTGNLEIHLDTNFQAHLVSNLSDNNYIISKDIFSYGTFGNFVDTLNKEIEKLYEQNFNFMPEECKKCKFFLKGCLGDHFKIISNKKYAL